MTAPEPPRRNIKLVIEYDGRRYHGWQFQDGCPSIQDEVQRAIAAMLGEAVTLTVAGRTDSGVHAMGQVANFRTASIVPLRRFAPGLNHHLPPDISVHSADEVPASFDAKQDSLSKIYRYRVYCGLQRAALADRAWHIKKTLDVDSIRAAAGHLIGDEIDFNAFRSRSCDAPHARRDMYAISIETRRRPPAGEQVEIQFHANAYCRHMCRILAGTLVEVGQGRRTPAQVLAILESRDRTRAGVTAPAAGLTLLKVFYPDDPPPGRWSRHEAGETPRATAANHATSGPAS